MGKPDNVKQLAVQSAYLVNARIILSQDEIADGSVWIEDGVIRAICPTGSPAGIHSIDLEGNILMPGLVDLHSDAIEHEVQPRPKTLLPFDLAVRQADRLFATVGVTTAFHSLSFWSDNDPQRGNRFVSEFARAIFHLSGNAIIDNRVHARFEITNENGLKYVLQLVEEGITSFVSIMDHTPGQGQYPDASTFREYCRGTGMSDEAIDKLLHDKKQASLQSGPTVEALSEAVRAHGVPYASHDDDLPERFPEHARRGITISEFPMNPPSSEAARAHGFTVLVGAPNVLRGQSTGSGPRAMELIDRHGANALCSDYMPATILPALFKVSEELDWPLWRAAQLGSLNPSLGAKLSDRGEIALGKRADLIEVEHHIGWPIVRKLWCAGRLTYSSTPIAV